MLPSSRTSKEGVVLCSSTNRGHHSLDLASSKGRQRPVLAPGASSSRGKAITFPVKGVEVIIRLYFISL